VSSSSALPASAPIDPVLEQALVREWVIILPRLLDYARTCSRSRERAKELVQEAWLALRDGRRTWNRDKVPAFFDFAASVIGSLWTRDVRGGRRKYEVDGEDDRHAAPASAPNPEQLAAMKEEHEQRLAKLLASFDEGDLCHALVPLFEQGIGGALEQAERLGVSVEEIYKAHRRFKYAMDKMDGREV
jgi:hypothetical protein